MNVTVKDIQLKEAKIDGYGDTIIEGVVSIEFTPSLTIMADKAAKMTPDEMASAAKAFFSEPEAIAQFVAAGPSILPIGELLQRLRDQTGQEWVSVNDAEPAVRECVWTWSEADYHWQAGCGGTWLFIDGGPEENEVKFCQCCGGKVVVCDDPAPGGEHG